MFPKPMLRSSTRQGKSGKNVSTRIEFAGNDVGHQDGEKKKLTQKLVSSELGDQQPSA